MPAAVMSSCTLAAQAGVQRTWVDLYLQFSQHLPMSIHVMQASLPPSVGMAIPGWASLARFTMGPTLLNSEARNRRCKALFGPWLVTR